MTTGKQAHPALTTPELLLEYFDYIHDPGYGSPRAIEPATRVCKLWRRQALVVRWREGQLHDLLLILGARRVDKIMDFSIPPSLTAWPHFEYCAARLVKLVAESSWAVPGDTIASTLLNGGSQPGSTPLGDLRILKTYPEAESDMIKTFAIMPQSLMHLDLTLPYVSPTSKISIIQMIPSSLPNLSILDLSYLPPTPEASEALAATLQQLPNLRSLTLDYQYSGSLQTLGIAGLPSLPQLENLTCKRSRGEVGWTVSPGAFPKLQSLEVWGNVDTEAEALLYGIAFDGHPLRRIVIIHPTSSLNLDGVLRATSGYHALQCLTLRYARIVTLKKQTMRILQGCGQLETLKLGIEFETSDFADEDLGELFAHLPRLKVLDLHLKDGPLPYFNLNALLLCLQHCPLAEHVSLYVDATVTTGLPTTLNHQHQALHELGFSAYSGSPIASARDVAAFLTALSSRQIHITNPTRSDAWDEVGRLTLSMWDTLDRQKRRLPSGSFWT
ncbi:hypothetical protein FRB97_001957 [Tulasnella sp. 331]|nr:hypothetical protein FRB97_001957 [Tulasnella sp. 331]